MIHNALASARELHRTNRTLRSRDSGGSFMPITFGAVDTHTNKRGC